MFVLSVTGILLIFIINPVLLWILSLLKSKKHIEHPIFYPSVSLIIVAHNAEDMIVKKVKNALSLDYPSDNYEIIVFSDGSTDRTEKLIKPFISSKLRLFSSTTHKGKFSGINKAVEMSLGEIIVFSDVDAIIDKKAIISLSRYFSKSDVGGVCGRIIIYKDIMELDTAQADYFRFDSLIKRLESQLGSISSNTGTLYAIRRALFQPVPPAVTDDLYVSLSIIKKNYQFIFEPDAKVYIKAPSINPAHEILRRRRIVSQSLRGIYLMRDLLNPFKYGFFSIRILINKIIRRLLPIFMLLIFFSSLVLSFHYLFFRIIFFLQIIFYLLAVSYLSLFQHTSHLRIVARITSLAYYLCLGNFGTLLGLIDFLRGKRIVKWEPSRTDK